MKRITSQLGRVPEEYFVVDLEEPTVIDFVQQIEDLIISSPDIDILYGCDYMNESDFSSTNSMLLKTQDNTKEFSKQRCTHFYLMPLKEGEKGRVYISIQR